MLSFLKTKVTAEEVAKTIVEWSFDQESEMRDLEKLKQVNRKAFNEDLFLAERVSLRLFVSVTTAQPFIVEAGVWDRFQSALVSLVDTCTDSLGLRGILLADNRQAPIRLSELIDERIGLYLRILLNEGPSEVCQRFALLCREGIAQAKYDDDAFFPFATATYKIAVRDANKVFSSTRIV